MLSDLFKRRESEVEKKIVDYAKKTGWLAHKLVSPGKRGVTDRFFTKKPRKIVFLEIKRASDEEPTVQQQREQKKLRDQGFPVFTVYSLEEAIEILNAS